MGNKGSKSAPITPTPNISVSSNYNKEKNISNDDNSVLFKKQEHDVKNENMHPVNPDIIVHSVVSADLDYDHKAAMNIKLGEVSDEQLLGNAYYLTCLHARMLS